nr:hypothetical protein [Tanacetum cinerariifolium]
QPSRRRGGGGGGGDGGRDNFIEDFGDLQSYPRLQEWLQIHSVGVRKAYILALQDVYNVDDNVSSLVLFTERFYKRTLNLVDDNDISFAVCAISLVKQLLRHQLVLDDDLHLGLLYDLLINNPPPEIRRAIRALAYDHVIAQNSIARSLVQQADQGGWENEGGTTSQLDVAVGMETEELFDFV